MKTYLRYSLSITPIPFSSEVIPEELIKKAYELYKRCEPYSINENIKLVLVPIDSHEYFDIIKLREQYPKYKSFCIYKHKYTKKEMDDAEYYCLKVNSFLPTESQDIQSMYCFCCNKGKIINEQIGNVKLNVRDIEKKGISFTGSYRYLVTIAIKEALVKKNIGNIKFIPSYNKTGKNIVAYQIEAQDLLPPLVQYNNWGIYKKCDFCGKLVYNPQHQNIVPFSIPIYYKDKLQDFNATCEQFTQSSSRYYIISKKLYDVLLSCGAKKLDCEPVLFV